MATGFAHFDSSHRENFCAAVLLLAMDVDEAVREYVARVVRTEFGIDPSFPLLGTGREARLVATADDNYARVDIWLLFGSPGGPFYTFVEVKTHNRWDAAQVARQVQDQGLRALARTTRRVHGSMLLAPAKLAERVRKHGVGIITWPSLLRGLRALASRSPVTTLAIHHLEDQMERHADLDRPITLKHFEQATTTIACLRQFLLDVIGDVGGRVKGQPLWITSPDGSPMRRGGWAWHGLSVPFVCEGVKGRVGIYKYAEAPPGEEGARETLWLEGYLGDADTPVMALPFAPATLAATELDATRAAFKAAWAQRIRSADASTRP